MGFTILNQNNYAGVPYPNSGNSAANIKSSGCGVVSMAMILANLAGVKVPVLELAAYSLKNGCRAISGTNMVKLAKCICRDYPELSYTTTNDETALCKHIESGGLAIMNADGDDGYDGIFAHYGHYLAILGVRDGKPLIADPAWTSNRYKSAYRRKYVTDLGGGLITCDWYVLNMDTKHRTPNYYLFAKKATIKAAENEEEESMYKDINEVPEWGKEAVQLRIDLNVTDGTNLTESMVRIWTIQDREDPYIRNLEDVGKKASYMFEDVKAWMAAGVIAGNGRHEIGKRLSQLQTLLMMSRVK